MDHKLFMSVAAVLALVVGLAFILLPAQLLSIYDIVLDADGEWIARCMGSAFVGVAVTTWFGKSAAPGEGLDAIMLGDFVLSITGLILAVLYALSGSANALIWSTAAIYVLLTAGFGYFRFVKPASA